MKKRIISLFLCAVMLLPNLTVRAAAANSAASAAAGYLKRGDYVVFSPAEKWQNGQRVAVATTEWELTAQHSGTANGNDVQTWKFGVSDKFYIENEETKSDGISYVRIQGRAVLGHRGPQQKARRQSARLGVQGRRGLSVVLPGGGRRRRS